MTPRKQSGDAGRKIQRRADSFGDWMIDFCISLCGVGIILFVLLMLLGAVH